MMADLFFYPSISASVLDIIRVAYGVLLLATLGAGVPHARRYFISERWGGYGQRGLVVDAVQNPVVMPVVLASWMAAGLALVAGRAVVPAALLNLILCHYFFVQMRWKGVLRGMGAPGFIAYWLGAAVLLLEYTRRAAPDLQPLALFVLQVDFACIMLSAGMYKFTAGYRSNEGMELGLVNPEWGYWIAFWKARRPSGWWFRLFNEMAWSTEVVAALLMLFPPTRVIGGVLILVSFIFIATQIRLGFLCEMVIVCCLLFIPAPQPAVVGASSSILRAGLWTYLLLLPFARAGLAYNFHAKKALPRLLQSVLDAYTNVCGLIIWRVFSADITNFFVRIYEQRADGRREEMTRWGSSLRYRQVAESITVTSLFTTLKYYPSNTRLFTERLLRYARTVRHGEGRVLVFEWVSVQKRANQFDFVPAAEYVVDVERATVTEHILAPSISIRTPAASSPIHEGAHPGSYVPLRS